MPQTCSGAAVPGCLIRPGRWRVALLVGLALSVGVSLGAQAATTWTVCASGCDYTSIKSAIAASTTLDGDTLAIAAGTYTEAAITVNKSLTLQGASAASTIVQAAASRSAATDRVFTITSSVTVTLQDLTIRYGHTDGDGGGVHNAGTLLLTDSIVRSNEAWGGGGIENYGTLTLTHTTVSYNKVTYGNGGGIENYGTLTLTHSIVSHNTVHGSGGGLANVAGTLTLTASTVSHNTAIYDGGLWNNGLLTLTASTVSYNTAIASGGLGNAGTLTLTNSTISHNTAGYSGGGLWNDGLLILTNSTISHNTAPWGGGGLYNYDGSVTLTASIVAKNPDGGDCLDHYSSSSIASQGYNLASDGSCELTAATDRPGVDPLLGPLQDNGGPTLTHALLPGSPALDAIPWGTKGCGTTVISDQRWQARPQPLGGACDIGAYEVAVAGQALGAWVAGFTPHSVTCNNVTTGQVVTLSDPTPPWDCEAAGLEVTPGDHVAMHGSGPVTKGATDVSGAVTGMAPSSGDCANLTTGQQVPFQHLVGATAASCVASGLVVQPGDSVQMRVQGVAE